MKMKSAILLIAFTISTLNCLAQNGINFLPKQLSKEIKSQYKCDKPILVELNNSSVLVNDPLFEKYFKINNTSLIGYMYIGRVTTCRAGICSSPNKLSKNDSYEFFDYFILFDTLAKILAVNVYNYEASHGQEITVKRWLNQFAGYNGNSELYVGKNIDAISGATISAHSITFDISSKTDYLRKYILESTD